ncbi:MAG TPA: hypothetical protein VFU49_15455 [Ktedonobacteraceae bacterium]|nr:hypothetical protein [Ktedonobacteraceae bacterium]
MFRASKKTVTLFVPTCLQRVRFSACPGMMPAMLVVPKGFRETVSFERMH